MAIKAGVKVEEFSIGFGPEVFGFNDNRGTRWKFSLLPLGGYVKMKGELLKKEDSKENAPHTNSNSFSEASLRSRTLIILSGPLANLLLGFLIITSVFMFNGKYIIPASVNSVIDNQPAKNAGLQSGDLINKINDSIVKNFTDIRAIVEDNPENNLKFEIIRNNSLITINIKPTKFYNEYLKKNIGRIGITAYPGVLTKLPFDEALQLGLIEYYNMTISWFKGFKALLLGNINKKDIVGPIGIAKISSSVLERGIFDVLILMAIMSINLGLINLLPIPILDGGHLCFYIYEALSGKPIPNKIQVFFLQFGFIFLMLLMLLVTAFDLGL
jgi:regulator of sigma E protease